jgi:hypothetical protein
VSDEIKGVAVLHDTVPAQVLFCVCVPDKAAHTELNEAFIERLPVRLQGTPKAQEPQWEYRAEGNLLNVSPSVRVSTTLPIPNSPDNRVVELFHNGGQWSIPFVRWSEIAAGRSEDSQWLACHEMNAALLG